MKITELFENSTASTFAGRALAEYRKDHTHPVNNLLHVGFGWPLILIALFLLPFRPLLSLKLVALAYAAMFAGHFFFEKNTPTILKRPGAPLAVAGELTRKFFGAS